MKLWECRIGVLVQMRHEAPKIGHVVSLMKTTMGEVIPVIHFADEVSPRGVHHGNLIEFTG